MEQLGDSAFIALDAGDLAEPDSLPSTVIDLTGEVPRVVREGAVTVSDLRAVCDVAIAGPDQPGK